VRRNYTRFVVTSNNFCVSSVRPVERFVTQYAIGMAACQKLA